MTTNTSLVLAALFAAAIHSASAQIITNGSFETPEVEGGITINAGETTLAPWVVGLTSIDLIDINNGFVVGPAYDGTQYIDLDGTPGPGRLAQAFSTTPGALYTATFAYANNYFNQLNASATVRIFDGLGDLLNETITHSTSQSGNLDWTLFSGQFVALQTTTTLEFTSLSPGGNGGILIDAVQIVPEPASTVLLLFGCALCLRRRTLRTNEHSA